MPLILGQASVRSSDWDQLPSTVLLLGHQRLCAHSARQGHKVQLLIRRDVAADLAGDEFDAGTKRRALLKGHQVDAVRACGARDEISLVLQLFLDEIFEVAPPNIFLVRHFKPRIMTSMDTTNIPAANPPVKSQAL